MKPYGALKRLQKLAGLEAETARQAVRWSAVARWASAHCSPAEAYAASEMLAMSRRKLSGGPDRDYPHFSTLLREENLARYKWNRAGCPGFKPMIELTYKLLKKLGYRFGDYRASAH